MSPFEFLSAGRIVFGSGVAKSLGERARKHGLRVVEDAAQSFGSAWRGRRVGVEGDFVAFSFHPNKNVTCIEGGALVPMNFVVAVEAGRITVDAPLGLFD